MDKMLGTNDVCYREVPLYFLCHSLHAYTWFLCAVFRSDMKQILSEVTDHMEQQYTAHRYLEKLRSENETLVLKEKEREV